MPAGYADYSLDQSGVLNVVNGGTGQAALTQNGVLLGNAGGPVLSTAAGTSRQNFQIPAAGTVPQFQDADFNKVDVTPLIAGVGVTLHGSAALGNAPGFTLYDDGLPGQRGALGLATAVASYLSDSQPGDICLRANTATLRLAAGTGATHLACNPNGTVTIANTLSSYHGTATGGQGVAFVAAVASNGSLTGATSYTVTLMATPPGYNWYRVQGYIVLAAGTAAGNTSLAVTFQDGTAAQTITFAPVVGNTGVGVHTQGMTMFRVTPAAAINLVITTGSTTTTFLYVCVLEQLQFG
jgi:hypothetical protein